jgi:HAE1 family hydrophobic/amphiphilic exporter-1
VVTEVRKRMRHYADLRVAVRNASSFNIGGGNFDIDFLDPRARADGAG